MASHPLPPGIKITGKITPEFASILTPQALSFVANLHRKFEPRRETLLNRRKDVLSEIRSGKMPDFLSDTKQIREDSWTVAPIPLDLSDRRVEITGPVDRKMVINALNSNAKVFMADFEDSHSPTWNGTLEGQINLFDAVRRQISFSSPEGKKYSLNEKIATLIVRPRGWHLIEKHVLIDGKPISASLFDFGLFFFHNAKEQIKRGTGPYFYLPKMESHLEARLWNDVFIEAQKTLEIARGTIRATVLIETILAAFEMHEILYELREHSAGLNCGRWDYIFSFIKKFSHRPDFVLPDRAQVTMGTHFLRSYSLNLIETCHKRGIHAMGGMAAQIPIKNDQAANEAALSKVRADKEREATSGHDGTWVAHPGLVALAQEQFDKAMPAANQISKKFDFKIKSSDLLQVPDGTISEAGLRTNINVSLLYLEAWVRGLGCVPLYNLMEDAATAEISRAQIWQWIRHPKGVLTDGTKVTSKLFQKMLGQEMDRIATQTGRPNFEAGRFDEAKNILNEIVQDDEFTEFITLPAYKYL